MEDALEQDLSFMQKIRNIASATKDSFGFTSIYFDSVQKGLHLVLALRG